MKPDLGESRMLRRSALRAARELGADPDQGELHDRATYRYFWELRRRRRSLASPCLKRPLTRFLDDSEA